VERLVRGPRVAHAVGGHDRQPQPLRQIEQGPVPVLLLAQPVALQFDVDPAVEEDGQPLHGPPSRVHPALLHLAGDNPLVAAGQAPEPA
jgi:hypothetical protein